MAKRRKLEAPTAEALQALEEEVSRDVARGPMSAPIAQVAAEAAGMHDTRSSAEREAAAKDRSDAEKLRAAEASGRVMLEIPLDQIDRGALVRDRVVIDREALDELKHSILRSGLRLPIEVFRMEGGEKPYGLLSGYRRLLAMEELHGYLEHEKYASIKAVVRDPETMGGTFAAMIEENEIRASLSHFERGRIAVIAAQQGVFVNTEEAVNALFPQASKAKRSKIRSFALIFEELGDMLEFPDLIKEKDGLRMAAALREGGENLLRQALSESRTTSAEEEAQVLEEALKQVETRADPKRGGRPKKVASPRNLSSGVRLQAGNDDDGWYIRITGRHVDRELVEVAMAELERLLDGPGR